MNQFKYIDGELWLDITEPVCENENQLLLKAEEIIDYENRLHYPCSPELKAILKQGQVYELGKDFILGLTTEGKDNFYNGQLFDIAIPLPEQKLIIGEDLICPLTKEHCDDECCPPGAECNLAGSSIENFSPIEQPPTEEGQQTTDVEQEITDVIFNHGCTVSKPMVQAVYELFKKWNQGKEAGETVKGDEAKSIDEIGKKYFQCNCGEIYLSRKLTAPDCPYHSLDWESAMEEYANQFRK